ncbi:MAG TPA: hypothetical protein VKD71_07465 [Gemmataceae bacterium]|nr:hypothetical protein [Gemmataceae bacterium]
MKSRATCPACTTKVMLSSGPNPRCPACGAGLKRKGTRLEFDENAPPPPKKKKKKRKKSGPNYPLIGGIAGGVVVLGALIWIAVAAFQSTQRPVKDDYTSDSRGQQPVALAEPAWKGKVDPPKANFSPKDDLSISIEGEPLFASGNSPFVADLVPVIVGTDKPPAISVYDMRTGQKCLTAKAIQEAQGAARADGSFFVALGPDGKSLAARVSTTIGTGRKAVTTSEALIYRLGTDKPVARIPISQHLSWMEFGRDEDQLLVVSAPAGAGFFATACDVKQPGMTGIGLEIPRRSNRWRNGFGHKDSLAVSPGRNYLAVGEGRSVELIQLSDGKLAGSFPLPGDCVTLAFSQDGKELTVHSQIAPERRSNLPKQFQWTTFSLADGKLVSQTQVTGGPFPGAILAAGPNPFLAVHSDGKQVFVTNTRVNAPAFSAPFRAVRCFESDRLLTYDATAKRVAVRRIDAEQLAAGEKKLAEVFGPRPGAEAADRSTLAKPTVPSGWAVPADAAGETPTLVDSYSSSDGAEFLMPQAGNSTLSAVVVRRVETPREHYSLQWQRVDMKDGKGNEPISLWPSMLPPGQVPPPAGNGSIVADQTADGSRLAVRDPATPARVDVWDKSGKRLFGFLPYGPETSVHALVWAANDRLITMGGDKATIWEIPGPKAVAEFQGYVGACAFSPTRKWIAFQTDKFIDFFETASGKPLGRTGHGNPLNRPWTGFVVSRDGTELAAVELIRPGQIDAPNIWSAAKWDLKTGVMEKFDRLFAGNGNRTGNHLMWLGPRLLLAGGADVIDVESKVVIATLTPILPQPLPSPDGRYWSAQGGGKDPPRPVEGIATTPIDDTIKSLRRPAPADIAFREGVSIEVVSNTGDNKRDAGIRSQLQKNLSAEGFRTESGGWKLVVSGTRAEGKGFVVTPTGDKFPIPSVSGTIQLVDPGGTIAWERSGSGSWDVNRSRYKTTKQEIRDSVSGGVSSEHFSFGDRGPKEAMADDAWDNFLESVQLGNQFPRVIARVDEKLVTLPYTVKVGMK